MKKFNKKLLLLMGTFLVTVLVVIVLWNNAGNESSNNGSAGKDYITYYVEDNIFAQVEKDGENRLPLENPNEISGKVFVGWDKTVAEIQTGNIDEVYAKHIDTKGEVNVIVLPAAYAQEDELVNLPLKLMGDVELCGIDIILAYDAEAIEYMSCTSLDADATTNYDEEAGLIYLRYVSASNTTAEVDLANLQFKVKDDSAESAKIEVHVKEAVALDESNQIIKADYGVIDGTIYIVATDNENSEVAT